MEKVTKKDWLRILSPATLGAGLSVIGLIVSFIESSKSNDGLAFLVILMYGQAFATLVILDILLKRVFKYKILTIWLIELFVLVIVRWIFSF